MVKNLRHAVVLDSEGYVKDVPDIRRPPTPKNNSRLKLGDKHEPQISSQELLWKLRGNQRPVAVKGDLWPYSPTLMKIIALCKK